MRPLTITLLLIFISCKTETKNETKSQVEAYRVVETENGIDKSVYEMWNNFTESNPQFKNVELPESDFFHSNKKDANRLAKLTVH